ncbi:MAG: hypothetical protein JWM53_5195 [bacterium]|nr:hypothetical protein [bacterium]
MKRALCLGLFAAAAACDPLATGSFRPPYVTINGTIDQSPMNPAPIPDGSTIRVALLWQNDQAPGSNYAEQLVDVTAHFPTRFSVDVAAQPRPEAIDSVPPVSAAQLQLDPTIRWATATIVVYADDGDGRFTTVQSGTSNDRVLGFTRDLDLFFLAAGKPAPADLIGLFPIAAGWSLVRVPPPRDPKPGECGKFTPQGHYSDLCPNVDVLPTAADPATLDEQLQLVDDSDLQRFTCASFWGANDYPDWIRAAASEICDGGVCPFCRGYQCPLDLPGAGDLLSCSDDKLSYVYKHCVDDPTLCGTRFCHFGHGERLVADPPPAGWPCN